MNKPQKNEKRWAKFFAFLVVLLLTLATIALLTVATSEGGWWILATILWLPPYYMICARLGHPVKGDSTSTEPDIIDL